MAEPDGTTETTDVCERLMARYSSSTAPQHRHLLAAAAALRSILCSSSSFSKAEPPTPAAYLAAAVAHLADSQTLDSAAVAALLSFVSILLPSVPEKGIEEGTAKEAVAVLVAAVGVPGLGVTTVSGAVKSLGVLILGFCDLDDWASVKLGFETLLALAVDKRPKVRRSAQDSVEKVLRSFHSSAVVKEASKSVLLIVRRRMPTAANISHTTGALDSKASLKPDYLEVVYVLNVLKIIAPFLSHKVSMKLLPELQNLLLLKFTPITLHVLNCIEAFIESGRTEAIGTEEGGIMDTLAFYISIGKENPVDSVILAGKIFKKCLDHPSVGLSSLIRNVPKVVTSLAGYLICESSIASQASDIIKEVIKQYISHTKLSDYKNESLESWSEESEESDVIRSVCGILEKSLSSCKHGLNEHLCGTISVLFQELGKASFIFLKCIVLKLAVLMNASDQDNQDMHHLQKCLGYAVVAVGPQKILELMPISINAGDLTCSNCWLIPILDNYVVGASLEYYMEHIVPLAKSFQQAYDKVEQSAACKDLLAHARRLLCLLPAFCRYPTDTFEKFGSLADLLIKLLKKKFMHRHIALSVQVLVSQNKSALCPKNEGELKTATQGVHVLDIRGMSCYSEAIAKENIRSLGLYSKKLLQALTDLFLDSFADKRLYMKDAVGSLASVADPSFTKELFVSLLQKFEVVNCKGEFKKKTRDDETVDKEQGNSHAREKDCQRCALMELATAFAEGAQEDLVELIYDFIVWTLQTNMVGHREAYNALSRVLEEHSWFRSSRLAELIELVVGQGSKSSSDIMSVKHRFNCFQILMVHMLEMNFEKDDMRAFFILNEIILTLKDGKDEARKVAYDTLLMITSSLRDSSQGSYCQLINMMMGYLSGSSPHITSGAVSALSIVVHNDAEICLKMPNLVPTVLSLLHGKAVEIIKAALGFVKVLVSSLPAKDLQNLMNVVNAVLPWSSTSRHHFREKVTVILEIISRKCGLAAVETFTAEKYKRFIKTVSQNHHKLTSKDASASNTEPSPNDPSTKMRKKRRRGDDFSFPGERRKKRGDEYSRGHPNSKKLPPGVTA